MKPSTKAALTRFDKAAQNHGWQQDQGSGSSVDAAEEEYKASKAALEKAIERESRRAQLARK